MNILQVFTNSLRLSQTKCVWYQKSQNTQLGLEFLTSYCFNLALIADMSFLGLCFADILYHLQWMQWSTVFPLTSISSSILWHQGGVQQFNSIDATYLELTQDPQVKELSPKRQSHFQKQLQISGYFYFWLTDYKSGVSMSHSTCSIIY